jgi:hypothetical protein
VHKYIYLVLITLCTTGCTSINKENNSHQPISSLPDRAFLKHNPVLIASDLQMHLVHNSNDERTNFKDIFSEAIRPVASDIFAPYNFESILVDYTSKYPTGKMIFLGDMTDVACKWELDSFYKLLGNKSNWVMAPGNHDSNYLGTFEKSNIDSKWKKACDINQNVDGRLNKNEYIFSYLSALAHQSNLRGADSSYSLFASCFNDIRKDKRALHKCLNNMAMQTHSEGKDKTDRKCAAVNIIGDSWVNCKTAVNVSPKYENIPNQGWWKNTVDEDGFLQDIFWYINPVHELYSFILQRVKLPSGRYVVLLDTNNPQQERGLEDFAFGYNPANSANMLYHQMNAAAHIMGGGDIFTVGATKVTKVSQEGEHVLMSHHPVNDYKFIAKDGLCLLSGTGKVKEIYTAHTHSSYTKNHDDIDRGIGGCGDITEYNIGSMIDAPIELSVLIQTKEDIKPKTLRVSLTQQYSEQCSDIGTDKLSRWKRNKESDQYYTAYTKLGLFSEVKEIQTNLMKTMIGHYMDMLVIEDGFGTVEANWPDGMNSDNKIKETLIALSNKLSKGTFNEDDDKSTLLQISEFFQSRKVKNMDNMKTYQACQLYWASEAKKGLSWYDRI